MKLHYLFLVLLLLPPLQARAAVSTSEFQEIIFISVSGGAAVGGTHYALKPSSSEGDRYRGLIAVALGLGGIIFYKRILGTFR